LTGDGSERRAVDAQTSRVNLAVDIEFISRCARADADVSLIEIAVTGIRNIYRQRIVGRLSQSEIAVAAFKASIQQQTCRIDDEVVLRDVETQVVTIVEKERATPEDGCIAREARAALHIQFDSRRGRTDADVAATQRHRVHRAGPVGERKPAAYAIGLEAKLAAGGGD
jgi:hypothetical protein